MTSVTEEMHFTKAEREAYEEHLKWLRVEANTLRKVEDTAYERGMVKGKAEERIILAKNFLKQGVALKIISTSTGLSIAELEKLGSH